jgi:hypothetical protein
MLVLIILIGGNYDLSFGWSSRQNADLPKFFDAAKDGARPKIRGEVLGGQCCAHLLNGSF